MTRTIRFAVLAVLVLGAIGSYALGAWRKGRLLTLSEVSEIPARLAAIPLVTRHPTFRGTRDYLDDDIVELSGADHYVAIDYRAVDGGMVRLHIGAAVRSDAWFHQPDVCLPAQGWVVSEDKLAPIWRDLPEVEPGTRIWRMMLHKDKQRMLVYYWFQYGPHIVTSRTERRYRRFQDLLAGERDRPIQIVIFYAPIGSSEARSEKRVASLVRTLWPELTTIVSPRGP